MGLFRSNKIKIYEKRGAKVEWTAIKKALKDAGIRKVEANAFDVEPGVICCGAGLDNRDYGEGGRIDRKMYNVYVQPEDEARAREILGRIVQA